jgi:hypothetical protein
MRIFVCSILLSCFVPSAGGAAILEEKLRDRLVVCSQLVIEHPGPAFIRDFAEDCCRAGKPARDCHVHDRGG